MADLLNLAMLISATVGAMAFGILAAYAVLRVVFALMRPRQGAGTGEGADRSRANSRRNQLSAVSYQLSANNTLVQRHLLDSRQFGGFCWLF